MPEVKNWLDCVDAFDQCACKLQTLRYLFYFVDVYARRELSAVASVKEKDAAAALHTFRNQVDMCFGALEMIDRLTIDMVEFLFAASESAHDAMKGVKPA